MDKGAKLIEELAEGNKSVKEVLKLMDTKRWGKLSYTTTLPSIIDKGIRSNLLGFIWKACEGDFVLFTAVVSLIPDEIVNLESTLQRVCFKDNSVLDATKEIIGTILEEIKNHRDVWNKGQAENERI